MNKSSRTKFLSIDNLDDLIDILKTRGYRLFILEGNLINDASSFFAEVKETLPLDPPLSGKVNWDAFSDSLWYGVADLNEKNVAIIWNNAENMMEGSHDNFQIAVQCFTDVVNNLTSEEYGLETPINLLVIITGSGKEFPSMDLKSLSSLGR